LDEFLLIGVNLTNCLWKVYEYYENPSASFMLTLLKKYLQVGSITIYLENENVGDDLGIQY
jgi:hypothetical protein